MSSISEDSIRNILNIVAKAHNIDKWNYSRQKFEAIAQNYFGVLIPVNLIAIINGEEDSIPLVLKLAPTDERYRVSGALTLMFLREIFVYTSLLEKYQEHQQNVPLSHQLTIPKCYYTCSEYCKEAIALQNMCNEGYKPYTKDMFLDLNHTTISLQALAKFHALSFTLRERDTKMFEKARKVCFPLTEQSNMRFMSILKDRMEKAIGTFDKTNYVPLFQYLHRNCGQLVESTSSAVNQTCFCHGDIWKENLLFQYMEDQPVSACLIDYQTVRMCSPAFDALYLIASSTGTELRRLHYHALLDIYYETFERTLHEEGLDSGTLYSRQAFEEDLRTVAPACLVVVNTALWLACGLQEVGHVISKNVCSNAEEKAAAVNKYRTIIKGIIDDFCSYNYLCL